jgi:hypothetical protein
MKDNWCRVGLHIYAEESGERDVASAPDTVVCERCGKTAIRRVSSS